MYRMNDRPATPLGSSDTSKARCTASDVLRWFGLPGLADPTTDRIVFSMRRVRAGRPLVVEGQAFERLFLVSGGSFKCVQTDLDGYEQVLAFAIHGDLIGLDGLGLDRHGVGAVALEDATVATLPFQELLSLGRSVPALETLLLHAAGAEVARRGDTQYLMAAPSSEVRVARFLLQFAGRQMAMGHSGVRLRMCMTRRDIASYLGVAHETVSRALTALVHEGCITVSHRDIELLDVAALEELQRVTRGRQGHGRHPAASGEDAAVLIKPARGSAELRWQ